MSLQTVIQTAESQLSTSEYPKGSNHVLYNTEYYGSDVSGDAYKWCVTFLWWVFKHANESAAFFNNGKTASCTKLMQLYKEEGRFFTGGLYQIGDLPIFNFHGTNDPEHCGLITEANTNGPIWYKTIEGNTTPGEEGSQDNGGCVAKKTRYPRNIIGVCRPNYSKELEKVDPDYISHWAKDNIEWAMKNGIANGYPDGSFKPNAPLTRAEGVTLAKNTVDYILGQLK